MAALPVGPHSQHMVCPYCHQEIDTIVRYYAKASTHIIALVLCLFLCWLCVCIPYCMKSCKNTNHFCPKCKAYIGTYSS